MLSIGRFAKLARVSGRTLRHYEEIGLIAPSARGDNGYRYYDQGLITRVSRIKELQALGFSLEEIREVLKVSRSDLVASLEVKLNQVEKDLSLLNDRKRRIETVLSVSRKIDSSESIQPHERKQYMDAIKDEIIAGLKARCQRVTEAQLGYLERDRGFCDADQQAELLGAIKKCVDFARERGLQLGPGRGSSPASMALFGLGFTAIDPSRYDLIPERLLSMDPMIHIDVGFERGQEFVDYCREITSNLSFGEIHAFKMPLIDIINAVHERLSRAIDYGSIGDDSDVVLRHFRAAEIEKIFLFDQSEHALVMKYENLFPGYYGPERMNEYLRGQKIHGFRDVINIASLWRPSSNEILQRLERYRDAKSQPRSYGFLSAELRELLQPNFGLVIYHEDVIRIIAAYTGWGFDRCNQLRRNMRLDPPRAEADLKELKRLVPTPVYDLILEETPWAFCQPHAVAFAQFTKQTAVLKTLHRELYLRELAEWEQKHGYAWDDIGIRIKGVSLLQH